MDVRVFFESQRVSFSLIERTSSSSPRDTLTYLYRSMRMMKYLYPYECNDIHTTIYIYTQGGSSTYIYTNVLIYTLYIIRREEADTLLTYIDLYECNDIHTIIYIYTQGGSSTYCISIRMYPGQRDKAYSHMSMLFRLHYLLHYLR